MWCTHFIKITAHFGGGRESQAVTLYRNVYPSKCYTPLHTMCVHTHKVGYTIYMHPIKAHKLPGNFAKHLKEFLS